MNKAKQQRETAAKHQMFNTYLGDPNLIALYYPDKDSLPDNVKNHPPRVQIAWLKTFNNNLARYGSVGFAYRAAATAMANVLDMIRHRERNKQQSLYTEVAS